MIAFAFLINLVLTTKEYDLEELYNCSEDRDAATNWFKKNDLYDEFAHACLAGKPNVYRKCQEKIDKVNCVKVVEIFWNIYVN